MTAVGTRAAPRRSIRAASGGLRVARLYAVSRRLPAALAAQVACAIVLRVAVNAHWLAGGAGQPVLLAIEGGSAVAVAVTSTGPFGEPERAAVRWLPYLRLAGAVVLTGTGFAALAAAAIAARLPGGDLPLLRDEIGLVGAGLLCAGLLGGALAWTFPLACVILSDSALGSTPSWMWLTQPSHDRTAMLTATLVFAAGTLVFTVRGARDRPRE